MKYTTDLREHNGKWYSRIEFTEIDTIPAGCRYTCDTISERKTLYDFNCRSGKVFARDFMSFLGKVYAPVDTPGGYPEGYEVTECGDTIEFKKRDEIRTSREALQDAINSGVAQAWIDGEELEYSTDNGPWKPYLNTLSDPDFLRENYRWRIKLKPIIPAKFDWRRIEEYDLKTGRHVLLRFDDYNKVYTGYKLGESWFRLDILGAVHPTHFTTFEE